MKGSERKQMRRFSTVEEILKQQIVEFLDRKRGESFEKA
jgi:hypothetical protein